MIKHGPVSGAIQMPAMTMCSKPGCCRLFETGEGESIRFALTRDEKGRYLPGEPGKIMATLI